MDLPRNPHDGAGVGVLPPHHAPQPHPHTHAYSHHQHQQMILGDSNGGDDDREVEVEVKAPRSKLRHGSKTRAKTWVQAEVEQALVGADFIGDERNRSPIMCTDKWRNLLKEFKKVKHQDRGRKKKKEKKGRRQKKEWEAEKDLGKKKKIRKKKKLSTNKINLNSIKFFFFLIRRKCTFSPYILIFFHFSLYILFFPLLVPKLINTCYFRPFC